MCIAWPIFGAPLKVSNNCNATNNMMNLCPNSWSRELLYWVLTASTKTHNCVTILNVLLIIWSSLTDSMGFCWLEMKLSNVELVKIFALAWDSSEYNGGTLVVIISSYKETWWLAFPTYGMQSFRYDKTVLNRVCKISADIFEGWCF